MWRIKTKLFITLDKFDSHNLDGSSEFKNLPAMIQRFDHWKRRPRILPLSFLREYWARSIFQSDITKQTLYLYWGQLILTVKYVKDKGKILADLWRMKKRISKTY